MLKLDYALSLPEKKITKLMEKASVREEYYGE